MNVKTKKLLSWNILGAVLFTFLFGGCLSSEKPDRGAGATDLVTGLLEQMTLEEKVGQMVQVKVLEENLGGMDDSSFSGWPSKETEEMIKKYKVGSVILYSPCDPSFCANYTNLLQQWAADTRTGIPLLIGADFETGPGYSTYSGVDPFPQQMGIAATGSEDVAREVSKAIALESRAMGIHWNYSPVADVNTNSLNPVIGVRSFGDNYDTVSRFVSAYVSSYEENGLISTPKHYPGHGDTSVDSHLDLPGVDLNYQELEKTHLVPFKVAIDSGASSIMTAHIFVPELDQKYPATLSYAILHDVLKEKQGFDGIIVTDGMDMGGIVNNYGVEEASVLAVNAGADVVMATGSYEDQKRTFHGILDAAKKGEISEQRIDEAVRKILNKKVELGLFDNSLVDPEKAAEECASKERSDLALSAYVKSLTLLKNEGNILPIGSDQKVMITGLVGVEEIGKALKNHPGGVAVKKILPNSDLSKWQPSKGELRSLRKLAEKSDVILITTYSSFKPPLSDGQITLIKELEKTGKPVVVLSLGLPYDIASIPEVDGYLVTYSLNRWKHPATSNGDLPGVYCRGIAEVLLGDKKPTGRLPVSIPGTNYQLGYGESF
jgi:beta-N-acetylhexosaminidase